MTEEHALTPAELLLPPSVVSKVDLAHLVSEVEWVDGEMTTAAARAKAGVGQQMAPATSEMLQDFLDQNKLTLDDDRKRAELIKCLRQLKDTVPTLHMTFAVQADPESLQKLAAWVREAIHPQAIIAVGLQPALVAGVYLRTPNHVHDLSVRGLLENRRGVLIKELESLRG